MIGVFSYTPKKKKASPIRDRPASKKLAKKEQRLFLRGDRGRGVTLLCTCGGAFTIVTEKAVDVPTM